MTEFAVISIPFLGTALGAAVVLLMRGKRNPGIEKLLLGFASGVMIAASVWSLLIPAIQLAGEQGKIAWIPASAGFALGVGFLLLLDGAVPMLRPDNGDPEDAKTHLRKTTMLALAVTLHNLPEGMAVGVTLAGALMGNTGITMTGALMLSVGIAIQNFPEGAIISMPLRSEGMSGPRACCCGVLSGVVEPVGAVATLLLTERVVPVLPYLLAFAAGAMIYVVVDELLPESRSGEHTHIGAIGVTLGFVLMMVLDVALG